MPSQWPKFLDEVLIRFFTLLNSCNSSKPKECEKKNQRVFLYKATSEPFH